ncbi:MAG: tetratricopeptide repeat protein [Methanoregula sp.]|nr:tetratricopeptide repeat protein [Methanoregula sp.]
MKKGQIIYILAILSIISCIAVPVMAADDNQTQDQATSLYNSGVRVLSQNDYANAILLFDQALASNISMIKKSDALLYTYQGKSYALIQLGKFDDAIQTVDLGLVIYPKDTMLWNNKGYALFKQGNYAGAVASYDKALSFDKNYTTSLVNKGDALYQMGRFQDAVDSYNKVLEINPDNSAATAGLAIAQKGAATSTQTTVIVLVVVLIVAAGGVIWYVKFRKPVLQKKPEKSKSKK